VDYSRAGLTAAAGVDPWALAEQLYSARPDQVRALGQRFRDAGALAVQVATSADAADGELAAAFLNNRVPVYDKLDSLKATKRALAENGELMEESARIVFGVAEGLGRAIENTRAVIAAMEAEVDAVIARRNQFMVGKNTTLAGVDLKSAEATFAREVVSVVRAYGQRVQAQLDDYEALLINHSGRMADLGYSTVGERTRRPLDEIESAYQVSADPGGVTTFPGGQVLTASEQAVIIRLVEQRVREGDPEGLPLEARVLTALAELEVIRRRAGAEAEAVFPGQDQHDNHADAFRHTYWNALLAREYGEQVAAELAIAHERRPDASSATEAMDLYNNEIGRRIAVEHADAGPGELSRLVEEAVRDGQTVVVGSDGRLAFSDSVSLRRSGDPLNVPPPPGVHPAVLAPEPGPGSSKHTGPGKDTGTG
jgi:hypothetical protein